MKRNPKKTLLTWLLTAAMLLSLLPTVALAASDETEAATNSLLASVTYEDSDGCTYTCIYTYDSAGNLLTVTYERSDGYTYTYTYTYDSKNNLLTVTYENNSGDAWMTAYSYDSNGNVVTESHEGNDTGSKYTTYTYDSAGNVLTETYKGFNVGTGTTTYTYNSAGDLLTEAYENSFGYTYTYTYTYDDAGNMLTRKSEYSDGSSSSYTYTYDSAGNLLTKTYESSSGTTYAFTYTYNDAGDLLTETYEHSSGTTYAYTYTYDSAGNLLTETYENKSGTTYTYTYTYDSADNLLTETYESSSGTDYTCTYTYDSASNLLTKTYEQSDGYTYTYTYTYTWPHTHDYTGAVTQAATCGEDGLMTYTCSVCGGSYTESIPATGDHTAGEAVQENVVEATATSDGSYDSVVYCTICGAELSRETVTVPATGETTHTHSYTAEVTTPATRYTEGVKTYTCTVCGATRTETIAKTGATFLFTDVTNTAASYYIPVYWAYDYGITTGTTSTTFSPSATCTRAQFVTFLWRLAGEPEPSSGNNPFTDVTNTSASYYKAVLWAVEQGVTKGTSATTFSPSQTITRAQAVTFLYRYAGEPAVSASSSFTDVTNTSASYYKAVIWAVQNGITNGTTSTTFSPSNPCTRGQMVTFLYRFAVEPLTT